jgi:hypothetical protein
MRKMKPTVRMIGYKDPRGYDYAVADLEVLVPDPENPRLPLQSSSLDTILALLGEDPDGLFNLAKDLVNLHGSNPAELLNVTPVDDLLVVKEGNRRLVARKILRNPEQLRDRVGERELDRWKKLSKSDDAKKLPTEVLIVIGDDHDEWVARRHQGPQGGVGVVDWDTKAKARHLARRRGVKDRALSLLDSLKTTYPHRFGALEPPKRTFTTFTRVLDSPEARAHLGIDVDEDGKVLLSHGERSLRLIEEVLRDLQRTDQKKLTSRRIPTTDAIKDYLRDVEVRVDDEVDEAPLTLVSASEDRSASASGATANTKSSSSRKRPPDILKTFTPPSAPRLRKIFEELAKVRRDGAPHAAMILTRVLLELSIDDYANAQSLPFAGDKNGQLEEDIKALQRNLSIASITLPKSVRDALKAAANQGPRLPDKLDAVIHDLIKRKKLGSKEGNAKIRELRQKDILPLLNDAVHRLHNFPTIERVDHVLEVVLPVFNAMSA